MLRQSLLGLIIAAFPASAAVGDVFPFFDQAAFEDFNAGEGKTLKFLETFEESNIPSGQGAVLDDPLAPGVPNLDVLTDWGFPNGLDAPNLWIQSNTLGPNAPVPSPAGGDHLLAYNDYIGTGVVAGSRHNEVDPQWGLDLIFDPNHTGVGFDILYYPRLRVGDGLFHISVFNKAGVEIFKATDVLVPFGFDERVFFGIWSDETIGRINLWAAPESDPDPRVGELVDNIQMWVPEPGTLSLLTLGGLALLRRRRR